MASVILTYVAMFADKGKWGEEMCDLVGNAARSGAITCVVSSHVAQVWRLQCTQIETVPSLQPANLQAHKAA